MSDIERMASSVFLQPAMGVISLCDTILRIMATLFDALLYIPLQRALWYILWHIPRYIYKRGRDMQSSVSAINSLLLARVFFILPIAWCIKYSYGKVGFGVVVFYDFLHQIGCMGTRQLDHNHPHHALQQLLNVACTKGVYAMSLWSLVIACDFGNLSILQGTVLICVCLINVLTDVITTVVHVQKYTTVKYQGYSNGHAPVSNSTTTPVSDTQLRDKLETLAVACLCLAHGKVAENKYDHIMAGLAGQLGMTCLFLCLRFACSTVIREIRIMKKNDITEEMVEKLLDVNTVKKGFAQDDMIYTSTSSDVVRKKVIDLEERASRAKRIMEDIIISNRPVLQRSMDYLNKTHMHGKVDKVITIGCFDLFHLGHVTLLMRMRSMGKQVIVGVHDSRSIYRIKNRVPVDSTETRMMNVRRFVDQVFVINSPDPALYTLAALNIRENETALYVRGDDNPGFPGKTQIEQVVPIKLLPYTNEVSSTILRHDHFAYVKADDKEYLEKWES